LQLAPQLPELQVDAPFDGAAQTLPHDPQFDVLVEVLTHTPLQFVVPIEQHTPEEQLEPVGHDEPHAPQFDALVERCTHTPPQCV
jgi:hypothetical protein